MVKFSQPLFGRGAYFHSGARVCENFSQTSILFLTLSVLNLLVLLSVALLLYDRLIFSHMRLELFK
jgi:hypothetical protein